MADKTIQYKSETKSRNRASQQPITMNSVIYRMCTVIALTWTGYYSTFYDTNYCIPVSNRRSEFKKLLLCQSIFFACSRWSYDSYGWCYRTLTLLFHFRGKYKNGKLVKTLQAEPLKVWSIDVAFCFLLQSLYVIFWKMSFQE